MADFTSQTGREAALRRWAREPDPTSATRAARAAFLARFEREVDPEGLLPVHDRQRRAERLLRAHMSELARRRSQPTT